MKSIQGWKKGMQLHVCSVCICVCVCVCVCVLFGGAGTDFELRVDFANKLLFCVTSLILRFNFWIFIHSTLIKVESKTFVRHFSAAAAAAAKSLQSCATLPHGQEPTRLCCPCDFPGKNTGMGCHFLLQCMKVKSESEVAQSCPTLHDPMDCSLPGSSGFMGFSRQEYWSGVPLPSPDISLRAVDSLRLECCKVGVLRVYMMFHILHNVVKDTWENL